MLSRPAEGCAAASRTWRLLYRCTHSLTAWFKKIEIRSLITRCLVKLVCLAQHTIRPLFHLVTAMNNMVFPFSLSAHYSLQKKKTECEVIARPCTAPQVLWARPNICVILVGQFEMCAFILMHAGHWKSDSWRIYCYARLYSVHHSSLQKKNEKSTKRRQNLQFRLYFIPFNM